MRLNEHNGDEQKVLKNWEYFPSNDAREVFAPLSGRLGRLFRCREVDMTPLFLSTKGRARADGVMYRLLTDSRCWPSDN
jgi:hypothetical protein